MNTATSASAGWAAATFLPQHARTSQTVVLAGVDRSAIVDAALADPALVEAVMPRFVPDGSPPCDTTLWRCETTTGEPLNRSGLLRRLWHRPPYAITIRLVQYKSGSAIPETLDEGTLGTRGPFAAFQAAVDRLAMRFVRDAALGRSRGPSLCVPAVAARGNGGWRDYQRARWRERLTTEWWSIGESSASFEAVVSGSGLGPIHWHRKEAGKQYLADPFPWFGTGRILCEEMPVRGGVGRIVAVSAQDSRANVEVVLEDGDHHSYPSTFREAETVYCVPEATRRGCTRIYQLNADGALQPIAEPAPHLRLADPTLFRHNGLYWLACTDLDIGEHDNLCLLWATSLAGPWSAHVRWPVKIDIRSARPAGAVFEHGGELFRPAQDCAATYGAAIAINQICRLTKDDFAETLVTVLRPDRTGPFPHGLHTLVYDGTRCWVDGKRFVFDARLVGEKIVGRTIRRFFAAEAQ